MQSLQSWPIYNFPSSAFTELTGALPELLLTKIIIMGAISDLKQLAEGTQSLGLFITSIEAHSPT